MKKLVLINYDFKDAYSGKLYKAGDKVEMTDERIAEVKGVNPEFVTVIGIIEEGIGEVNEEVIGEVNVAPVSEGKTENKKSK